MIDITPEVSVPGEQLKQGPIVTNSEITRRVGDANSQFVLPSDLEENLIIVGGSIAEYLGVGATSVQPLPDPSEDVLSVPEKGTIFISGSLFLDDISAHLWEIPSDEVRKRLDEVVSTLGQTGLKIKTDFSEYVSWTNAGGSQNIHRLLRIAIGDKLKSDTDFDEYDLNGPKFTPGEVDHALVRDGVVFIKFKLEKKTRDPVSQSIRFRTVDDFIELPYLPGVEVSDSLAKIEKVFAQLREKGLFSAGVPPSLPSIKLNFNTDRKTRSPLRVGVSLDQYRDLINKLHKRDLEQQTSPTNDFAAYCQTDIRRVPLLSYEEAVRTTRQINPKLAGADLIAREEICEAVRTDDGWEIMLPASDYSEIEPGHLYTESMIHARIEPTWKQRGREAQLQRLKSNQDRGSDKDGRKNVIRGYFYELASGDRFIAVDADQQMVAEVTGSLHTAYQITGFENVFNRASFVDQLYKALDLETSIMRSLGIGDSDIKFYSYWYERFHISQDRNLEAVTDKVAFKFEELQKKIYDFRQKG